MIRYKCPKCFHDALLPNEMSYKFFICPACRWQSQVFGPLARYEQDDGRFGEKSAEKLYAFLPAGAPKLRKVVHEAEQAQPTDQTLKPQQGQAQPRQGKPGQGLMQQEMEEVPLVEEELPNAPANPADFGAAQNRQTLPSEKSAASHQGAAKVQKMSPPPYQRPQGKKYGAPPPPPPSNAGRTGRPGQSGYASRNLPGKPLPSGAVGAFVFAILSVFVPCVGIVFGLIAMIAAGAIKKKMLETPNAYSGLGLVKAAQFIGAIGFVLSWIILFAYLKS